MTDNILKILVIGGGAIGTYLGGSLALKGNRVVFLERPEAAAALRQVGMRLTLLTGTHAIKPEVMESLNDALNLTQYDAVLFAVKSYHTALAAQPFAQFREKIPPVLCMQNGVENEAILSSILGQDRVIAGTLTSAIGKPGPGTIVLEKLRGVGVAGDHPIAYRLVDAMMQAGLNARHYASAPDMKWSKLLTNLISNATSAILDMPAGDVFKHPGLYALEMEQLREALAVMDYLGYKVVDLPGTPVRLLAFAVQRMPDWLSRPFLKRAAGSGRGGKMPSFHIDLYSGSQQSEVEFLNGAVVQHGLVGGIPTPVNDFLTRTLLGLTRGQIPLETYAGRPDAFLESFHTQTPRVS